MNFQLFKNKFCRYPFIRTKDILFTSEEPVQSMRNQISRWEKKGLLLKIKKGMYILNENDRKVFPSRFFFANQIIWPSYVSLESALSYYGLIPERVEDVTSVTTKKTSSFNAPLGEFVYRHLKTEAFKGYRSFKDEAGLEIFIAEPEKAVVDFLYLNLDKFKKQSTAIFRDSYRFQNVGILSLRKIMFFSGFFNNKWLTVTARQFCAFAEKEKK